jgi:PPOX class probable F420-dependent enzyme
MTEHPADAQKRGRRIAMTAEEVDDFLRRQRTCRVATVGADGAPHVTPLWFVWDGACLWLNSLTKSQRWTNLERDGRIAAVVDGGEEFLELVGVELEGSVEPAGDVPRSSEPREDVAEAERLWGEKYMDGHPFVADGRHAWLRMSVDKIVSWDFRKIPRPT